jgi:hypothetical protein
MTDPRNVAHDKKVQQAKKHRGEEVAPGSDQTPQPGKKTHMEHHASDVAKVPDEALPVPTEENHLSGLPGRESPHEAAGRQT